MARNGRVFFKVLTIFVLQILIGWCMLDYFYKTQQVFVPPFYHTSVSQMAFLLAMHMYMQPKVTQALQTLNFIIEHPYNFTSQLPPILFCLMNILALLTTQMTGFVLALAQDDASNIIGGFANFFIISEMPRLYF